MDAPLEPAITLMAPNILAVVVMESTLALSRYTHHLLALGKLWSTEYHRQEAI